MTTKVYFRKLFRVLDDYDYSTDVLISYRKTAVKFHTIVHKLPVTATQVERIATEYKNWLRFDFLFFTWELTWTSYGTETRG